MAILAINMSLIRSIMYDGKEGERRLRTMTERMYTWTRREGGREGGRERREGEEGGRGGREGGSEGGRERNSSRTVCPTSVTLYSNGLYRWGKRFVPRE